MIMNRLIVSVLASLIFVSLSAVALHAETSVDNLNESSGQGQYALSGDGFPLGRAPLN